MESRVLEPPARGNANWFEKSGVNLQYLTEERERLLVRVIGRFEKMRVREIGIPLYFYSSTLDEMLVHRSVNPGIKFAGIHLHLGGERHCESKVSCPRTQHNVSCLDRSILRRAHQA